VPIFGIVGGQPGVAGGPAQLHFGGGAMQGPNAHDVQVQILLPTVHVSPFTMHT
jgi:hypothetical protein